MNASVQALVLDLQITAQAAQCTTASSVKRYQKCLYAVNTVSTPV